VFLSSVDKNTTPFGVVFALLTIIKKTMDKQKIQIVEVPINELRMAEYNPRKHSKEQSDQLKESIKRFGMVDPIICNSAPERKNIIIGGHFRLEAAKELGMATP